MFWRFWNNWLGQIKSCSSCLTQSAASLHSPPLTRLPGLTLPLPLLNSHWSVSPPPRLSLVQSCHAWWRSSLFILFKDLSVRGCVSQVCLWFENKVVVDGVDEESSDQHEAGDKLKIQIFNQCLDEWVSVQWWEADPALISPTGDTASTNTSRNVTKIKLQSLVLISLLICQN